VSNEQAPADDQVQPVEAGDQVQFGSDKRSRFPMRTLGLLIGILIIVDVLAILFVPPIDTADPAADCPYPVCFIEGTLHFPRPHEVWVLGGAEPAQSIITFQVSLTDSLATMIGITLLVLALIVLASRGRAAVPGFFQNFVEWGYESLTRFGRGMGGDKALPYIPLFAAFFVLILAFNWSGLVPPVGLMEGLRAPTSDLNVTIGLAMVAFFTFHIEGFRHLGARGYLSKFLPFYEFKKGVGAGLIAMFVGFMELFLEFIKPVTLSMRLFGNIFGGEVALGVVTGLFIALIPVALYGLEIMLTFVQALIFSTLTLMFVLTAVESHHQAEGHMGEEAVDTLRDALPHEPATGNQTTSHRT
jgi:F-type H+-transporting ATPase subunit a